MTFEAICQRFDARRVGSSMMAKCPAHDDHDPSLSIDEGSEGKILLKCWGGCPLEEVLRASQLTIQDLFAETGNRIANSGNGEQPRGKLFDWDGCVQAFSDKAMEAMAKSRGFSMDFVVELKTLRMVGVFRNHFALPVFSKGRVVGVQYRIKEDHTWRYYPEITIENRVWAVGLINPGEPVDVFESNFDGLSFMERSGYRDNILITRGAGNAKTAAALVPSGAVARLYTQNDAPGEQWEADFCAAAKCTVKRVKIPIVFKDFNQWMKDGEPTPDEVIAAIGAAEIIKQGEQTWKDLIASGILATPEFALLELPPRQKLLGDWFCEGDLGMIFGPRGGGKTWFVTLLSRALSTGGTVGEWKGHQPVKMLIVDGEMPAELMKQYLGDARAINPNLYLLNHEVFFQRSERSLNLTKPEIQQALTSICLEQNFKVLLLDNLSTLFTGMKENDADHWEMVLPWLLHLRRQKISVVIVHHAGRSGEMRGTSKREDAVFWIISLASLRKEDDEKPGAHFVTRFSKPSRNTPEPIVPYEWHIDPNPVTGLVEIRCCVANSLELFRKIVEAGVEDARQISDEMGLPGYTISRFIKKAIAQGWLKRTSRGKVEVVTEEA